MATHWQRAAQSGSSERQNLGAVNSFEEKKGWRGAVKLQTENHVHESYSVHEMLYGIIGVTIVCNFALKKYDFRGWWSATLKNRGR